MPKRRLSKQQQQRIEQQHSRRRERLEDVSGEMPDSMTGLTGKVITRRGQNYIIEDSHGKHFTCSLRRTVEAPVCGDEVIWQAIDDDNGVIVTLLPRRSILKRPSSTGQEKLIAANIDHIIIVCAPIPELNTRMIDRYLVAAELLGITPVIIVNKTDLLTDDQTAALMPQLHCYQQAGYRLIFTSAKQAHQTGLLSTILQGACSIVVGQSGVGKSTLLNQLLGQELAATGEISHATNKGRHTTTAAYLYHLPQGGDLIDSPGVREFGLGAIAATQLVQGFREFRDYLGTCQFRDCIHKDERGCAIRAAVADRKIDKERYESYLRLLEETRQEDMY